MVSGPLKTTALGRCALEPFHVLRLLQELELEVEDAANASGGSGWLPPRRGSSSDHEVETRRRDRRGPGRGSSAIRPASITKMAAIPITRLTASILADEHAGRVPAEGDDTGSSPPSGRSVIRRITRAIVSGIRRSPGPQPHS